MKKYWKFGIGIPVILFLAVFLLRAEVIFQRGNPLPYLTSAAHISEERPFVEVEDCEDVYISKRGECSEFLDYVETSEGMEFVEQAGSGYIFTDGTERLVVSSEVYWGKYTVWSLPVSKDRGIR